MSTQFEIFKHFGVTPEKRDDLVKSQTFDRTREIIISAIYDSDWIALAGPIGSGKTEAAYAIIDELRDDQKYRIVEAFSLDRKGITISNVMNSIVYQLGDEIINRSSPRRDKEARTMQVLNILAGAKKDGKHVVLMVDEAHELHGNTIKALKRLHEYRFMGEKKLITIIMIGQMGLLGKVKRDDEIRPRVNRYELAYTMAEKIQQAEHHSFGMLNRDQAKIVAGKFGTPLEISDGIYQAMRKAYRIGADTITLKHFDFPDDNQQPDRPERKKIEIDTGRAGEVDSNLKSNKKAS